jgi:hypothetical protein
MEDAMEVDEGNGEAVAEADDLEDVVIKPEA